MANREFSWGNKNTWALGGAGDPQLGGGNSNIFDVHPENWGRCPTHFDLRIIFQMGWKLKPPTRPVVVYKKVAYMDDRWGWTA